MNRTARKTGNHAGGGHQVFSRRRFLRLLGGSAALAVAGGAYSWRLEPHWIEVVRRDLPIANLPLSMAGRTLALVGDLHIGPVVDGEYIRGAMDRINSLRPDLIAIVGDFMTCHGAEQLDEVFEVVGRLTRPPLGILAVPGNHDYGLGWASPETAAALFERLGAAGISVLRNELAWVDDLQVVGLDDLWAHDGRSADSRPGDFFRPEQALASLDRGRAGLVLAHNPDCVDLADRWDDCRGWILCGHTHGGQVDLPVFGPPLLPVRNRRYVEGEIDLGDGRRLYINRGLGYLRRVRFFSRPEITLFRLTPAADTRADVGRPG